MPNWVRTQIVFMNITDEQFKTILEQYCTKDQSYGNYTLDFEKLIPMPDNVFRGNLSFEDRANHPGDLNWYDWSVNHWGTKWNATDGDVDEQKHELLYSTAWSYAEPPVFELAERLRDAGILTGEAKMQVACMNEDILCGARLQFYDEDGYWDEEHEFGSDMFWEIAEALWGITKQDWESEQEDEQEGE